MSSVCRAASENRLPVFVRPVLLLEVVAKQMLEFRYAAFEDQSSQRSDRKEDHQDSEQQPDQNGFWTFVTARRSLPHRLLSARGQEHSTLREEGFPGSDERSKI